MSGVNSLAGTISTGTLISAIQRRAAGGSRAPEGSHVAVAREPAAPRSRRPTPRSWRVMPWMPSSGQSAWAAADHGLDLGQRGAREARAAPERPRHRPTRGTGEPARWCRRRRRRCRRGARGGAPRAPMTTLPPHDWPTTTARSKPSASMTAARSSVTRRRTRSPPSGLSDWPWPRRSTATARGRPRRAGSPRRPTSGRSTPGRAPAGTAASPGRAIGGRPARRPEPPGMRCVSMNGT